MFIQKKTVQLEFKEHWCNERNTSSTWMQDLCNHSVQSPRVIYALVHSCMVCPSVRTEAKGEKNLDTELKKAFTRAALQALSIVILFIFLNTDV